MAADERGLTRIEITTLIGVNRRSSAANGMILAATQEAAGQVVP
jgi:hypothetical protein